MAAALRACSSVPCASTQARTGKYCLQVCAANAANVANVVSVMPELRFVMKRRQMFGKPIPRPACVGRSEIVDPYRNIKRWMDIDQPMHMISLAAELDQLATQAMIGC